MHICLYLDKSDGENTIKSCVKVKNPLAEDNMGAVLFTNRLTVNSFVTVMKWTLLCF